MTAVPPASVVGMQVRCPRCDYVLGTIFGFAEATDHEIAGVARGGSASLFRLGWGWKHRPDPDGIYRMAARSARRVLAGRDPAPRHEDPNVRTWGGPQWTRHSPILPTTVEDPWGHRTELEAERLGVIDDAVTIHHRKGD